MKVLMVCLGNICRSPLAEGILRKKIQQKNLNIEVDSAGTGSWHIGENPDPRAVSIALKYGIDISGLIGRQFTMEDFDRFDRILVMDDANYSAIMALARNEAERKKVELILNHSHPATNACVPDPYFGGQEGFERVYRLLDEACEKFLDSLNK
jgi:protein-tyrosine phosphatase